MLARAGRVALVGMMGMMGMAAVFACAGGGNTGETNQSSAFDPTNGDSSETDDPTTTTTTTTGVGMTSVTVADATSSPPPDDSCCSVAPAPGCGNPETESCVCAIQTSCCQSVWNQDCVDLAMTCNDPACPGGPTTADPTTGEPGDSSGEPPPPMLTCDQLAAQEGWMYWRCQTPSGSQCNGQGTPTTDCTYCCEYCGQAGDISCGDYATSQGWGGANCEWNGNGACGGQGTPTCDCNFCCQV